MLLCNSYLHYDYYYLLLLLLILVLLISTFYQYHYIFTVVVTTIILFEYNVSEKHYLIHPSVYETRNYDKFKFFYIGGSHASTVEYLHDWLLDIMFFFVKNLFIFLLISRCSSVIPQLYRYLKHLVQY